MESSILLIRRIINQPPAALIINQDATPDYFQPPHLERVLPYLLPEGINEEAIDMKTTDEHHGPHHRRGSTLLSTEQWNAVFESDTVRDDGYLGQNGINSDDLTEQRLNFIEILRSVYRKWSLFSLSVFLESLF